MCLLEFSKAQHMSNEIGTKYSERSLIGFHGQDHQAEALDRFTVVSVLIEAWLL